MTEVYKRLSSGEYPSDIVYTAPENSSAIISNITLTNKNYGERIFNIHTYEVGGSKSLSNVIYNNNTIQPFESLILEPGVTLGPGESILIDVESNISASIFGSEISNFDGYKILGQSYPQNTAPIEIYTNSSNVAIVKTIVVTSTSSSDKSFYIAIKDSGQLADSSDYLAYNHVVNPRQSILFSSRYPIEPGQAVEVSTPNGGDVVFTVFGVEYAAN